MHRLLRIVLRAFMRRPAFDCTVFSIQAGRSTVPLGMESTIHSLLIGENASCLSDIILPDGFNSYRLHSMLPHRGLTLFFCRPTSKCKMPPGANSQRCLEIGEYPSRQLQSCEV